MSKLGAAPFRTDDGLLIAVDTDPATQTRTVDYTFGGPGDDGYSAALAVTFIPFA